MRHRERQGAAGQRQAVGQQPAAEFGEEPVRAGRGAGLVHQPGEGPRQIHGQIHTAIMPSRPLACHLRRGDGAAGAAGLSSGKATDPGHLNHVRVVTPAV
jgi:hypothetical protein